MVSPSPGEALSKQQEVLGLIAWLAFSFVTAAIGAVASAQAQSFYAQLQQSDWAPPPWLFGPVWTTLFIMMGIAAWLVWRIGGFGHARTALLFYLAQLVCNALWSWLFFAWQLGSAAFIDIMLLIALISITVVLFWRLRPVAGILLIPYLLWVGFAACLNYSLWQMNPDILA